MVEGTFTATNWKTRIELTITPSSGTLAGTAQEITPYNAIAANFTRPITPMDSVDDSNIGYIYGNRRYTFYIEAFPTRSILSNAPENQKVPLWFLNELFLNTDTFSITMNPIQRDLSTTDETGGTSTWAYKTLELLDCVFTTGGVGTYDSTAGLKVIRFDGLSLGVHYGEKFYR